MEYIYKNKNNEKQKKGTKISPLTATVKESRPLPNYDGIRGWHPRHRIKECGGMPTVEEMAAALLRAKKVYLELVGSPEPRRRERDSLDAP